MTENKNVLFVDFNGVLSYKPFWFYLSEESHEHHNYWNLIQDYLFKNISTCQYHKLKNLSYWINNLKKELDIMYSVLFHLIVEKTLGQGTFGKVKLAIH